MPTTLAQPPELNAVIEWPCPVCAHATSLVRLQGDNTLFQVVECQGCGLARTYPPVPAEEIHRYYPPSYYGANNQRFHPLLEKLVTLFRFRRARKIHRRLGPGRVLDVGCGRGHFLAYLKGHGWQTFGVELSEVAARHARDVYGIDVYVGDIRTAPYESGWFDAVIFWHVLEHLPNAVEALAKARELLRPGGLLVVAVPNYSSLQARVSGRRWFHLDIPRHDSHWRAEVLRTALAKCGFAVERADHFCLEQNIYGWLQSLYNLLGFEFNLLYNLLKNRSARDLKAPFRAFRIQTAGVVLALPILFPLSCLLFLVEVILRRGGTIEVYARKKADER